MPDDIGLRLSKYKHMIFIALALAALASYFLPQNFVFAGGHGNTGIGNTGNLNGGNGNTGNLNSGSGNTGNHNSGSGFIGNNCGSGNGHFSCIKNGKIVQG